MAITEYLSLPKERIHGKHASGIQVFCRKEFCAAFLYRCDGEKSGGCCGGCRRGEDISLGRSRCPGPESRTFYHNTQQLSCEDRPKGLRFRKHGSYGCPEFQRESKRQ